MSLLESLAAQAPPPAPPETAAQNGRAKDPTFTSTWTGKGDLASCDTLQLLKDAGLYGRDMGGRKHAIKCPWASQHSDDRPAEDSDCVYYKPSPDYPLGGFECRHAHCVRRTVWDVFIHFGPEKVDGYCSREWKPAKAEKAAGSNQATLLVNLALAAGVELFHTPEGACFATVPVGGHRENWTLSAKGCREWLGWQFFQAAGKAPGSQAMQDALSVLGGHARFAAPELPVYTRLAEHDGRIYLFLADDEWRVIEVDAAGWRFCADPPVKFRKPEGMLPLPVPIRGGSLAELWPFVNVNRGEPGQAPHDDRVLLLAWLVAGCRPRGPYTVLELRGEQGCAKSTSARALRMLLDPNVACLRMEPKEPGDLAIAAKNGWVVAFDNLSGIQPWLSDCLCRLATGGGLGKRKLYSDDDEVLFDAVRPVVLTGIHGVAYRSDLLDRSILLTLPRIKKRRTENEFWTAFDQAHPRILGALLAAVSTALKNLPTLNEPGLPRMADFAEWVVAAEPAFGWTPGTFLGAYARNRQEADGVALESSPVAAYLRTFLEAVGSPWNGTVKKLLGELTGSAASSDTARKSWPDSPEKLSSHLRRIAPNLRNQGLEVEFLGRTKEGRLIRLSLPEPAETGDGSGDGSVTVGGDGSPDAGAAQAQNGPSGDGSDGSDGSFPYESCAMTREEGEDGAGGGVLEEVGVEPSYRHHRHPAENGAELELSDAAAPPLASLAHDTGRRA